VRGGPGCAEPVSTRLARWTIGFRNRGYLAWIASRYEELEGLLAKRVQRLRGRAYGTVSAVHARLPGDDGKIEGRLGNLAAISVPSIVPSRHNWKRTAEKALDEVAAAQPSYHQARSALRF